MFVCYLPWGTGLNPWTTLSQRALGLGDPQQAEPWAGSRVWALLCGWSTEESWAERPTERLGLAQGKFLGWHSCSLTHGTDLLTKKQTQLSPSHVLQHYPVLCPAPEQLKPRQLLLSPAELRLPVANCSTSPCPPLPQQQRRGTEPQRKEDGKTGLSTAGNNEHSLQLLFVIYYLNKKSRVWTSAQWKELIAELHVKSLETLVLQNSGEVLEG